jgi:hypothetical protein
MKKFIVLPMLALLAIPAMANSTRTTTTRTYDSSTSAPAVNSDAGMIESEEEGYSDDTMLDSEDVNQQRMEESRVENRDAVDEEEAIDYSDRTRTNRERKALNTGGDASDDH